MKNNFELKLLPSLNEFYNFSCEFKKVYVYKNGRLDVGNNNEKFIFENAREKKRKIPYETCLCINVELF